MLAGGALHALLEDAVLLGLDRGLDLLVVVLGLLQLVLERPIAQAVDVVLLAKEPLDGLLALLRVLQRAEADQGHAGQPGQQPGPRAPPGQQLRQRVGQEEGQQDCQGQEHGVLDPQDGVLEDGPAGLAFNGVVDGLAGHVSALCDWSANV